MEETGEHIIRKIQDWLATESSSGQVASLPEDTTHHLLVGVSIFLSQTSSKEFPL